MPTQPPPEAAPKRSRISRPTLIVAAVWALLPWLFALVYRFHPFDHADPFWLPALPFVVVSNIPMLVAGKDVQGFPLQWVAMSSIFNLTLGLSLAVIRATTRANSPDRRQGKPSNTSPDA